MHSGILFRTISLPAFIVVSFVLVAGAAAQKLDEFSETAAQEPDELSEIQEQILSEIQNEITDQLQSEIGLEVDDYHSFFRFDDSRLRKLKLLAKGIALGHSREIVTDSKDGLEKSLREMSSKTQGVISEIAINRRKIVLDENEEKEGETPQIEVRKYNGAFRVKIQTSRVRNSANVASAQRRKFEPFKDERWKKAIAFLTDEQWEGYQKHQDARKRTHTIDLIVSLISVDLIVREDQEQKLREWLSEEGVLEMNYDQSIQSNAAKFIAANPLPDFFSEQQKRVWRLAIMRMGN